MIRRLAFEDFSDFLTSGAAASAELRAGQTAQTGPDAGYEMGYQAGWDDATATMQKEQTHIRAELAHNLQDMGFTYHEARAQVMRALEPLLEQLVGKVVPKVLEETLGQHIIEAALPLARSAVDAPIEVVLAPENRSSVEPVLASAPQLSFVIQEEPTLGIGQVYLRAGKTEMSLDFSETLQRIEAAFSSLTRLNKETVKHG